MVLVNGFIIKKILLWKIFLIWEQWVFFFIFEFMKCCLFYHIHPVIKRWILFVFQMILFNLKRANYFLKIKNKFQWHKITYCCFFLLLQNFSFNNFYKISIVFYNKLCSYVVLCWSELFFLSSNVLWSCLFVCYCVVGTIIEIRIFIKSSISTILQFLLWTDVFQILN